LKARNAALIGAAVMAFAAPARTSAQPVAQSTLAPPAAADDISAFYNAYKPQPIWTRAGINEAAAAQVVAILQRAPFDGFAEGPQLAAQV